MLWNITIQFVVRYKLIYSYLDCSHKSFQGSAAPTWHSARNGPLKRLADSRERMFKLVCT
jgi:hypothetical protein